MPTPVVILVPTPFVILVPTPVVILVLDTRIYRGTVLEEILGSSPRMTTVMAWMTTVMAWITVVRKPTPVRYTRAIRFHASSAAIL